MANGYTIAGAEAEIQQRIIDTGGKLVPAANLLVLLNNACQDFSAKTRSLRRRAKLTITVSAAGELSVTEATLLGTANCNVLALESAEWNIDTGGTVAAERWLPLNVMDLETMLARYAGGGTWYTSAVPRICAVSLTNADQVTTTTSAEAFNFYLFPNPGAATYTNRLRIEVSRTHTDLSTLATTQSLEFRPHLHEGPIAFCEWKAAHRDGRENVAAERRAEYLDLVAQGRAVRSLRDGAPLISEPIGCDASDLGFWA